MEYKGLDLTKLPISTNCRGAHDLAKAYGYNSVNLLAEELPENAMALDVGSGFSNFGLRVCQLRDDAVWVNLDPRYEHPGNIPSEAKNVKNLHHVWGCITELSNLFGAPAFDRVYSYWLLPYLTGLSAEIGEEAVYQMLNVTRSSGKVAVGPLLGSPEACRELNAPLPADTLTVKPPQEEAAKRLMAVQIAQAVGAHWEAVELLNEYCDLTEG